jgi:hypothetical protein
LLPYAGGLYDQPAKLIELINMLNGMRTEDDVQRLQAQAEKAKKASKRKG